MYFSRRLDEENVILINAFDGVNKIQTNQFDNYIILSDKQPFLYGCEVFEVSKYCKDKT